jgi:hypothetical protein
MSIDLIDLVKASITPGSVDELSRRLQESHAGVQKALEGGVPAILAGMAGKTASAEGVSRLLTLFGSPAGPGMLANFGSLVRGSGSELADFGGLVVQTVLGDKAGPVADAISSQSGVRVASAASLLGISAPLAVGAICKVNEPAGVTISSLLQTLNAQQQNLVRALPAGLGGVLGGAPLAAGGAIRAEAQTAGASGGLRRFWPFWLFLAVIIVGGLIWSYTQETSPVQSMLD